MNWAWIIVALLALQRLGEVILSNRNTAALIARGGHEEGRAHYPVMIALHVSWLIALLVFLPSPVVIYWPLVGVMVLCQVGRLWIVHTLGPYWTTRIITLPSAPLVTEGPYRLMRHPNYVIVVIEIAVLPLAFGEYWIAGIFSILNAAMLAWRIRVEDAALALRRSITQSHTSAA